MSSRSDAFNRKVSAHLRAASMAEAAELRQVLAALSSAQRDLVAIVAQPANYGMQVSACRARIAVLTETLSTLITAAIPAADARGLALVDDALAAAGYLSRGEAALVDDALTARTTAAAAAMRRHTADLDARLVATLAQAADPEVDVVPAALIGAKLVGSRVFGAPSAYIAGNLRGTLGDAFGAAITRRARDTAADPEAPPMLKRWVHVEGKVPRPGHQSAAARYASGIPWGQQFVVDGNRAPWPRGPGLPGPDRYGCKCQLAPVLKET